MKSRPKLQVFLISAIFGGTAIFSVHFWKSQRASSIPPKEVWRQLQKFKGASKPAISDRERKLASLGRAVFNDSRFSENGKVSCASCHQAHRSFTDGLPTAKGIETVYKNTPTLINVFLNRWFFWDGRADSLEAQAAGPFEAPREHGLSRYTVAKLIAEFYRTPYENIFGPLSPELVRQLATLALPRPRSSPVQISSSVAATVLATVKNSQHYNLILQEEGGSPSGSITRLNWYVNKLLSEESDAAAEQQNLLTGKDSKEILLIFMNTLKSIASFERGLVALDSPFDRFLSRWMADSLPPEKFFTDDFTEEAYQGLQVFIGKGQCILCHTGSNFTDGEFHNIGIPDDYDLGLGRSLGILQLRNNFFNCLNPLWEKNLNLAKRDSCLELPYLNEENLDLVGAFKTPTLRNLATTAPYMHNGLFATLDQVIEHYDKLATPVGLGHREESLKPLSLSSEERSVLIRFLNSLNSEVQDLTLN